MSLKLKDFIIGCCVFLVSATIAYAGSIKVWGTNDVLRAADLNANFQHIHNTMVGGHGPRLVDADIAANAAISTTKLASNNLIPSAWGVIAAAGCLNDGGTCTQQAGSGITSVRHVAIGVYHVTLANVGTGMGIVQASTASEATYGCWSAAPSANPVVISCDVDPDTGSGRIRFVYFLQ